MRYFYSLAEAIEEVKRDVYKGTPQKSSRVQQFDGIDLEGRERIGYQYAILTGFPTSIDALVDLGQVSGFPVYIEYPSAMRKWLAAEEYHRLWPETAPDSQDKSGKIIPLETVHPVLANTIEGSWPSYTYKERLYGALDQIVKQLRMSPDTRRAYWPIFTPADALRAGYPTRVPCSLGYQFIRRTVGDSEKLIMIYYQRSSDFDTFWLSDVWLARQFQEAAAQLLEIQPGTFMHFIASFHSFNNREEIY